MKSTNENNVDTSDPFMSDRRLIKPTNTEASIAALLIGIIPVKQTSVSSSILGAPLVKPQQEIKLIDDYDTMSMRLHL
ncbi:MAG: hypothetical protein WCF23_22520 [Candidatus Nitrosopolaris sp.]